MVIKFLSLFLIFLINSMIDAHPKTFVAEPGELIVVDDNISPKFHLVDGFVSSTRYRLRLRKHITDRSKKQITRRIVGEGRRKPRRPTTEKVPEKKLRRGTSADSNDWTLFQRTTIATPIHHPINFR